MRDFAPACGLGFVTGLVLLFLDFCLRSEALTGANLPLLENFGWVLVLVGLGACLFGLLMSGAEAACALFPKYRPRRGELTHFIGFALLLYVNLVYLRLYAILVLELGVGTAVWVVVAVGLLMLALYPRILRPRLVEDFGPLFEALGRRVPLITVAAAGLIMALPYFEASPDRTATDKPHVMMVTADSVTARSMSLYGYPENTTPNLAAYARRALVYENCFANTNGTSYAIPCFLGNMPFEPDRPHPDKELLPAVLARHGYRSVFLSFLHLRPEFRNSFSLVAQLHRVEKAGWFKALHRLSPASRFGMVWLGAMLSEDVRSWNVLSQDKPRDFNFSPEEAFPTEVYLDTARQILKEAREPTFVWVHLFSIHYPYYTRPELRDQFEEGLTGSYDAALRELDGHLGNFLEALETDGLAKKTTVILSSDHGESLFHTEGGWTGPFHTDNWLNERVCHIPLVVRLPGQQEGQRIKTFVQQVDIAPTVLDALELPPVGSFPGRSVLSFRDRPDQHREDVILTVPMSFFVRSTHDLTVRPRQWTTQAEEMFAAYADPFKVGWFQVYELEPEAGPGRYTLFKDALVYGVYNRRQDPRLERDLQREPQGIEVLTRVFSSPVVRDYVDPWDNGTAGP